VVAIEPTLRRERLDRLYETVASAPVQQRLTFTAQPTPRLLSVSGALRCVTPLDDGARLEGCEAKVPAGRSGEVVLDLAVGALEALGGTIAVAVTGIAGPDGGQPGKPVGTVWFGWAWHEGDKIHTRVALETFAGDREAVRRQTVERALRELSVLYR
jgi:hypothetical protein